MMTPITKTFTFALPGDLKDAVKDRDGTSEAEQIRRAIAMWLEAKGVRKVERRRPVTRKRSSAVGVPITIMSCRSRSKVA
jgi:hypothetical protein